jgi:hypothetical protein
MCGGGGELNPMTVLITYAVGLLMCYKSVYRYCPHWKMGK